MLAMLPHDPANRRTTAWIVAAAVAAVAAATFGGHLRAARSEARGMGLAEASPSGAPALVSLASVALGGFRGVAADLLWLRAGKLQEERKFVELVQLSEWITALEPESDEIWSFHAWNLAYNVTVLLGRPDDRWRWIESAISLLRDRGMAMNPGSSAVKRELAWLFLHKIGTDSDSASQFYRTTWAREISGWLGSDGEAPPAGSISSVELAESLKMDAGTMALLENRFGQIDWRVPDASALYWGWAALRDAIGGKDELPCRRMVYSSLLSMMRGGGRLDGDPTDENWEFSSSPNFDIVDTTGDFLEETMRSTDFSGVHHAYMGWLRDAIAIRLSQRRIDNARALHSRLVSFFAQRGVTNGVPPLEDLLSAPDGFLTDLLEQQ